MLFVSARPSGQAAPAVSPDARWLRAVDAWEAGAYPAALEDLQALMKSPAAPQYLERVALLSGELFPVAELTADGRNPKVSGNGQYVTYEAGPPNGPVTRVVRMGSGTPQVVAELPTTILAFDPAGAKLAYVKAGAASLTVRDLATGAETSTATPNHAITSLAWAGDSQSLFTIAAAAGQQDIYRYGLRAGTVPEGSVPERITDQPGGKGNLLVDPRGQVIVYQVANLAGPGGRGGVGGRGAAPAPAAAGGAPTPAAVQTPPTPTAGQAPAGAAGQARGGGAGAGRGGAAGAAGLQYVVFNLATRTPRVITGTAMTMSADGGTLAWLGRDGDSYSLFTGPSSGTEVTTIRSGRERLDAPALSPDGKRVAYQLMSHTDWEIYISESPTTHRRLTRDIQHDLLPRFLDNNTLLGLMGEARHRRAQIYDLTSGTRTRVFSNNTIRTISPEYIWASSGDGRTLVIQADRDGDTVSTERGVYVVALAGKVSAADVSARLAQQAAAEADLRARMTAAFKPVAETIRAAMARASITRVFEHEKTLVDFDSKHITQPGNRKAIEYLQKAYQSFGYPTELQEFSPPALQGGSSTANVIATKRGTEYPELIYVLSSHFDSVAVGSGADDDTSGTAALLETARLLADVPLPATVVFASFTGEESGLLGSREFVRLAAQAKWNVVGALNNDMIGWGAESSRMDNTIRYSNPGIKDIQHGAAFLFTNLITYDAKYYRGTDAAAFYEAWGDIVGGIGSYPVLANPNYHQPTDFLETMNIRQIMETGKVTAATLVYLASSPSRLKDVKVGKAGGGVEITWTASPEKGVQRYVVAYGPAADPLRTRVTVTAPRALLPALPAGTHVAIKAVNARGLEGWDWARTVIQ